MKAESIPETVSERVGDHVRIAFANHGHSVKIEVNGVEIRRATKLQVSMDGGDRMSRVTIELAPEIIAIDGEVAVLELMQPNRVFIPRKAAGRSA